jgi:hypothetical protein
MKTTATVSIIAWGTVVNTAKYISGFKNTCGPVIRKILNIIITVNKTINSLLYLVKNDGVKDLLTIAFVASFLGNDDLFTI